MHACMDRFWHLADSGGSVQAPGRQSVREHIATALMSGWSPEGLATWVHHQLTIASKRKKISSVPGFIVSQLKQIPAADQPTSREAPDGLRAAAAANRPGCDDCDLGWITQADGRDAKCPTCFPAARKSA